jgi:pentatricopeptide repeat protein
MEPAGKTLGPARVGSSLWRRVCQTVPSSALVVVCLLLQSTTSAEHNTWSGLESSRAPAVRDSSLISPFFAAPWQMLRHASADRQARALCVGRSRPIPSASKCRTGRQPARGAEVGSDLLVVGSACLAGQRQTGGAVALGMQSGPKDDGELARDLGDDSHSEAAVSRLVAPWVARSESRRITANLKQMLNSDPGRARAYFDALCLEGKADSYHYSVMMDSSQDIVAARSLLNQMRKEGLVPQTTSFNVLLKKMCLEGNMEAAEDLLVEMEQLGVPPDERSYTQLVCGYSDLGSTELAERVFQRMRQAGYARHVQTWEELVARLLIKVNTATLASMLSKGADHRSQAECFYKSLVASNTTDVVLFNIMLNASRTVEEARKVWHDMECVANLAPSTTSYNTLLRVLCENERMDEGMQLLLEAETAGLADTRTYTRIIYFLHQRGEVDMATEVYARCQERLSVIEDADAFVPRGACAGAKPMEDLKASPEGWTGVGRTGEDGGEGAGGDEGEPRYMSLVRRVASAEKTKELHHLLQAGRLEEAWSLFESWVMDGSADTYSYNTIMHGFGDSGRALALKHNMTANGVPLSMATWNILVQLLAMEGRITDALDILDEMELQGLMPTDRTLNPLLKSMRAGGQVREARRLQQRCKLQRLVSEKEALAANEALAARDKAAEEEEDEDKGLGAEKGGSEDEDGMTEAERKDAAAARVAAAIVEQQTVMRTEQAGRCQHDGRGARKSVMEPPPALPPPPGGWGAIAQGLPARGGGSGKRARGGRGGAGVRGRGGRAWVRGWTDGGGKGWEERKRNDRPEGGGRNEG